MIETAISATAAGQSANTAAIVQAAVDAAMSGQVQAQQNMRKPNFPPFDPKNIDQWIRRVNASFDRLNIASPNNNNNNNDRRNEICYGNSDGNRNNYSGSGSNNNDNNKCCFYHNKFGDKAKSCEPGCMMYAKYQAAKGQASR